jgi:hypothetical protein
MLNLFTRSWAWARNCSVVLAAGVDFSSGVNVMSSPIDRAFEHAALPR